MLDRETAIRACCLARACPEGVEWLRNTPGTPRELWEKCEMGSWMLGLAARAGVEREKIYIACMECVKLMESFHAKPLTRYPNLGTPRVDALANANSTIHAFGDITHYAANCAIEAAHAIKDVTGRTDGLKLCADMVRKHITWEDVERGLGGLLKREITHRPAVRIISPTRCKP